MIPEGEKMEYFDAQNDNICGNRVSSISPISFVVLSDAPAVPLEGLRKKYSLRVLRPRSNN